MPSWPKRGRLVHNPSRMSERGPGTAQAIAFGPFLLERRLAVGGSAEVFLARPKSGMLPAPKVVVKRLLSGRTEDQFGILDHEASLHRAVDHPNVVRVFGAGMVGQEPYLAMEYVQGVDLYRLLRQAEMEKRRLSIGVAVYVARCLAAALSAVHSARLSDGIPLGIVHRDVTPSNVYLSVTGEVKLGDFGIARVSEHIRPPSGKPGLKGKFAYVAPEQITGDLFDHRADLFALAAILGEMLIGERVFPGDGQLAVLLAIRDGNIGPLKRRAEELPEELFAICERGLAREPDRRFQDGAAFAEALAPFEQPSAERLKEQLAHWVRLASDEKRMAQQIHDSVERMRAVGLRTRAEKPPPESVPPLESGRDQRRISASQVPVRLMSPEESAERRRPTDMDELAPRPELDTLPDEPKPVEGAPVVRVANEPIAVRRTDGQRLEALKLPRLLELVATGELSGDDEVSFAHSDFRRIDEIPELARHLLSSTTQTTKQLFKLGTPDMRALLSEMSMREVLASLRQEQASGAVFVERTDRTGQNQRKELHLERGRLLHVASSDRTELLGEYLVRRGALTRAQLDLALASLSTFGGRLGDTVIGLGFVDAVDVFRAIRDQGRDRVAAICGWKRGTVSFYRDADPGRIEFPLDLDLASPMMAGAIVESSGNPRALLPRADQVLEPGPRHYRAFDPAELGTAPRSLRMIPKLVATRPTIASVIERLTSASDERHIGEKEAAAALVVAGTLGWVSY